MSASCPLLRRSDVTQRRFALFWEIPLDKHQNSSTIRRGVYAAMLAALCCITTLFLKIPLLNGYIHLGDCFCLLSGWLLGPWWGGAAAGLGSALADFAGGYPVYIPATLVIKAGMAMISSLLLRKKDSPLFRILSATVSEIFMVVGYFLFECFLYGFAGAIEAVLGNLLQAAGGILCASVLWECAAPLVRRLRG